MRYRIQRRASRLRVQSRDLNMLSLVVKMSEFGARRRQVNISTGCFSDETDSHCHTGEGLPGKEVSSNGLINTVQCPADMLSVLIHHLRARTQRLDLHLNLFTAQKICIRI